uniref:Transmembrane protein 107 n=1 Tax=Panagrolaimus sp. PS1159 TaxID=55785 RepID=A0AC35FBK4_9BILA
MDQLMGDFLGPVFLAITAHATLLFCAFYDKNEYIFASLPIGEILKQEIEDYDASITVCLALSVVFAVLEILFLLRQIPSVFASCYSLLSHVIASIFLCKFITDFHPIEHFWIVFAFGSCPTLLLQLFILANSFNKQKIC